MNRKKYITTTIREYVNENHNYIDYDSIPENILKTLESEYGHYYMGNFDWNKQLEFFNKGSFDGKGWKEWLENNKREEFTKNIDKIITYIRQDLILKIKQRNADKVLNNFEELITPVLGDEIKIGPISKYLEIALLTIGSNNTDINYVNRELTKAFNDAKSIIDPSGSINHSKITQSEIFSGDEISLPNFERFVQKNPEYKGVFDDWKKLFDKHIELSLVEPNAFRSSVPYSAFKELYNFLINLRKNKNQKGY
jgi:hypothetical protein